MGRLYWSGKRLVSFCAAGYFMTDKRRKCFVIWRNMVRTGAVLIGFLVWDLAFMQPREKPRAS